MSVSCHNFPHFLALDADDANEEIAPSIEMSFPDLLSNGSKQEEGEEENQDEVLSLPVSLPPPVVHSQFTHMFFIGCFAVFGTILRAYMGRFFGLDCEQAQSAVQDFMTPLSERICVTASGLTLQTGGALFIDLPSNMLGSFIVGVISPVIAHHPIPWFRVDHHLQGHLAFHNGLRVGLCGCLTTFASWNTQMVIMLDGTGTVLGPQVAPAIFGYVIGTACAVASFLLGRHMQHWLRSQHISSSSSSSSVGLVDHESDLSSSHHRSASEPTRRRPSERIRLVETAPPVLALGVTAVFIVGDAVYHISFYRKMWMSVVLSPVGAIWRWKLSTWNNNKSFLGPDSKWFPWGTLTANLIASIFSIAAQAVSFRYLHSKDHGYLWWSPFLGAVQTGFAGSLSTVSTMVKEIFELEAVLPARAYIYCLGTIICSMLLSLLVYSPMVRSG